MLYIWHQNIEKAVLVLLGNGPFCEVVFILRWSQSEILLYFSPTSHIFLFSWLCVVCSKTHNILIIYIKTVVEARKMILLLSDVGSEIAKHVEKEDDSYNEISFL